MPLSDGSGTSLALRDRLLEGERAMQDAELDGRAVLDAWDDDLVRSYAATGLLHVALDSLDDGLARDAAIELLEETLAALRGRPV